jgi:hypothetical protein
MSEINVNIMVQFSGLSLERLDELGYEVSGITLGQISIVRKDGRDADDLDREAVTPVIREAFAWLSDKIESR